MADDELPPSLQESILATLVFDEPFGAQIAAQVEARHFDDAYRPVATTILAYRQKYGRPPGRSHLDDMFGKAVIEGRSPRLRRLLFGLSALADGLNAEYVAHRAQEFIRRQTLKGAILESSALYQAGGLEPDVTQIEQILDRALRVKAQTFDPGIFLNDTKRSLAFLEQTSALYSLGIKELDWLGVGLVPKELLLYIGPKGTGKTWACVHCGKQGITQQAKVLHVSLEFRKELIVGRYYQSLFAAARRPDEFDQTVLEFDKLKRLVGFQTRSASPKMSWADQNASRALIEKLKPWGVRLGRLVVQDFPSGYLTVPLLEHYLDYLEYQHKFVPTILIIDYPALMALDKNNIRVDLGRTVVALRGLAHQRNLALFAPHQGNRSSLRASKVRSDMAAEDITVVNTADTVMSYSQTGAEKRLGLARLSLEHARNVESGFELLITQSYTTGQFVLQSAYLNREYWKRLEQATGQSQEGEDG